jgi:transcriptional regulator of acetoin/glycerol metabolism
MGNSKTSDGRASALPPASSVRAVHELFVAGEVNASYLDSSALRPVVAESWQRSLATGVDPDLGGVQSTPATLTLEQLRETHPLAAALPVIRRLLVQDASDAGVVVAVTAVDGTLLWVEGDRAACQKAEAMNFVPGADCRSSARNTSPGSCSRGAARRCPCTTPSPESCSGPST